MKLHVHRYLFNERATIGKLDVDGEFFCYTLEDADRKLEEGGQKVFGKTAIPRGIYPVKITLSNRFKRELPLLVGVPQFEGVRIHPGNKPEDTEGCLLVGSAVVNDEFISNSRIAFDRLFERIRTALSVGDGVWVEVT